VLRAPLTIILATTSEPEDLAYSELVQPANDAVKNDVLIPSIVNQPYSS
jgi:hypothetical protein